VSGQGEVWRAGRHEAERVLWRRGNLKASVTIEGLPGRITSAQAVALARAQDGRMSGGPAI
jgi:hypothetical protein